MIASQHDLMVAVLMEAGGIAPETLLPPGYVGQRADVLFPEEDIIIEVKSLTTDRAADPKVEQAVSDLLVRTAHLGGPVMFGRTQVGLHELPLRLAADSLRIIGQRVLSEVRSANAQIKATKAALERPNAKGMLALVTPPFKLDRRSVAWLVGDALRQGRNSSVNTIFLVETPLAAEAHLRGGRDSFMNFYSRNNEETPRHLGEAIFQAWGRVTGQVGRVADEEDFHGLGATS